ncbi:MAG: DUF309 domain-containing protein [Verrucomicrobiota bacterium]
MSKKSPKIAKLIENCHREGLDPHYVGYFQCFNQELYYEAHDVLEELWLQEGKQGENYAYYKGLIQAAGAFVHMQKHDQFPQHKTHGRRLEPASRLLKLSLDNLAGYGDEYLEFDLKQFRKLCQHYLDQLLERYCKVNPWTRGSGPKLSLVERNA